MNNDYSFKKEATLNFVAITPPHPTENKPMTDINVVLKRFETPDELREFDKGKFELVSLGGMTIGRATYQPGWKWSEDVGSAMDAAYCHVEHVGMVVSGSATAPQAFPR